MSEDVLNSEYQYFSVGRTEGSNVMWLDTVIFHAIQRCAIERFLFQLGDMRRRDTVGLLSPSG